MNGVPTAAVISGNPTAQSVDSLRFVLEQAIDFNVDAWGNVTIPMGSFDALRVKADETATTTYFAYCSLLTGGGWYPLPASIFPSEICLCLNEVAISNILSKFSICSLIGFNNREVILFLLFLDRRASVRSFPTIREHFTNVR